MSCTTNTTGNQSKSAWGSVMCLCLFTRGLQISKGKALLFWGWGRYSAGSGMNTCIYIFFSLSPLIRAMTITYILNRAIHSIILRNRKSHLPNSCLQMSGIKINQSIFWLCSLTISTTLQNVQPTIAKYCDTHIYEHWSLWSLIVQPWNAQ